MRVERLVQLPPLLKQPTHKKVAKCTDAGQSKQATNQSEHHQSAPITVITNHSADIVSRLCFHLVSRWR